jgi:protocatechuate 3,4-dioxygenase beta subunit
VRRWLPIVLLLALAGIVALVLRWRAERVEPVAAESAPAQPAPADPEHAVQSETDRQRVVLAPAAASAAQLVVHVRGKFRHAPVAGVRVSVDSGGYTRDYNSNTLDIPELLGEGRTDSAGDLTLSVRANEPLRVGVESLRSSPLDWVEVPNGIACGSRAEVEILLPEEDDGRVVGRVVCAGTREPVARARVRVLTGGQTRDEERTPDPHAITTGNDGTFELAFSLASDPRLCVEAEGYGLRYANLDRVHADLAHVLVVNVSPAATLSARVLNASGAPIEGAWVELSTKGYLLAHHEADEQGFFSSGITFSFPPDEHWRALTGPDGRAKIEGLPARVEISVEVEKAVKRLYREPTGLTLQPGEVKELVWRVGSGTLVHGLALDQDGKPVAGLEIWVAKASPAGRRLFMHYERERVDRKTKTDGKGRFTIEDLAPGQWSIGPGVEDRGSCAPTAEPLEITGEPALELTLHVYRGLFIRGHVLTPNGEGAQNAWVNGFLTPIDRIEGVRTESDGSFALGPLGPGTLTLMADAVSRFASSDPVQASAGDSAVVLQLKQGGMIRGRVVDGVTGVACTAQLVIVPEQMLTGILASGMQTSTNPDGTFDAAGLAPGRWSVTAATADGKFAQHAHLEVGAGSDSGGLVFALSPGGKLRLGYKGEHPWLFVTITRDGAAVMLLTGVEREKFTEYMAPAGSLVLEIRKGYDGAARTRALELKAGETKEITLTDED